ncbi:helix-turn-helix domain-containing protein [Lysinibacillus sp. BW-2-10]|uniref:helix-turn-helix domain-containing protein n=1 Tax=Lysinibacillus sp. BW-2-10 TaxID=2590030 RepID=UPI00117F3E04|nr:helix-turn-helix transcriptional regulator [Lysinibacillus sp. BW-2-10]TSI07656.1 helix-turn-helix transcriptional regulator [Lysinibacillus sp. BW-2-10]
MKIILNDVEKLRMTLVEKGYSQRAFSKSIGMSENYLNQIMNNKKNPSPMMAKRILSALELNFNDVFEVRK